jgi:hypothetical protein
MFEIPEQCFKTALAGVTKCNADGASHQSIIKELCSGAKVLLFREPDNPHDKCAIVVKTENQLTIGYIPHGDIRLAWHMDSGGGVEAEISAVNKFTSENGDIMLGVSILIKKLSPDWSIVSPIMDRSRQIKVFLEKTRALEDRDPAAAIEKYKKAIQDIEDLDISHKIAPYWRRARHPIGRLSMLLVKSKRLDEALHQIQKYEKYRDEYGLSAADADSLGKRKINILKKLSPTSRYRQ